MSKNTEIDDPRRAYANSMGPLYDLLDEKLLQIRSTRGFIDVPRIAKELETSTQYMYICFKQRKVLPAWVAPLIKLSKNRITLLELLPFVIPDIEAEIKKLKR